MKLLYCNKCNDIFLLVRRMRTCYCGASRAWYVDNVSAEYSGNCTPIGIANNSFKQALENQPEEGTGKDFIAFVIPKKCETFTREVAQLQHVRN